LIPAQRLSVICACVLLGILTAGLWPFHAPKNDVAWLGDGNGLFFGKHGSIATAGILQASRSQTDGSCSLEMWLAPNRLDSGGTILAFYWPTSGLVPFSLRAFRNGLVLGLGSSVETEEIYVGNVFRSSNPVFITITSGEAGTATYADGVLIRRVPSFTVSSRDLTGRIVIADPPFTSYSWSGRVKGLAIYDRELTAAEVAQHFADRGKIRQPDAIRNEGGVASYLFNEGKGAVVHNQLDSATDLLMPERFFLLHAQFLGRPWDEYRPGWHYWKDIVVNIVGFIPLGFFFRAYFSTTWKIKRATGLTIVLGLAVSLTIEVLQAFLPTRDSGMTDLFTNTFGTALGALLFTWCTKRSWFAQVISSGQERL
jgi:VanZ family protein